MSTGSLVNGYDIVVCSTCGFGYANDIPDQSVFDSYYREMSKYEHNDRGGKESDFDMTRFAAIAKILTTVVPKDSRILEIGSATGGQLKVLKDNGYSNVTGLAPSPVCAETAQRLHGIHVICASLNDLASAETSYDLIILSNVLEHIRELKPALSRCRDLLHSAGLLFIQVPNSLQFARWQDAPFQQFSTEHINFFSPVSLKNLLMKAGFLPVSIAENAYAVAEGQIGPVIDAMFRCAENKTAEIPRDLDTEDRLKEYIQKSSKLDQHIRSAIDHVVESGRQVVVWGVGTHTKTLGHKPASRGTYIRVCRLESALSRQVARRYSRHQSA